MSKVQYTVRLEEPLLEQLKVISQKELRSLNNQIEYFIAKGIEQYQQEAKTEADFTEGFNQPD